MQNDFSTIKTSNLYFPKLHVIRARKKKKMNYYLKQNNNFYLNINFDLSNEKLKTNYLSINTFKLRNQNYPQTPPNTFRCKIQNPPTNPKINRYSYRQLNEVNKNNNHRTITKEKMPVKPKQTPSCQKTKMDRPIQPVSSRSKAADRCIFGFCLKC